MPMIMTNDTHPGHPRSARGGKLCRSVEKEVPARVSRPVGHGEGGPDLTIDAEQNTARFDGRFRGATIGQRDEQGP